MLHVIQELVLVKEFADEAERQLEREDDFGNGLAVSVAQDSVELLMRIVVRERGLAIEPRAGLDRLVAAIDKAATGDDERVPHVARIEDLNKARVSFKHAGTAPSRPNALRLVRFAVEFLEVACPRFFGVEYRSISIVHQVRSDETRRFLVEAERLLTAGEYRDAMIEAADAVRVVESQLGSLFPSMSRANVTGDNNPGLINYMNGLRLISLGALVGYDPRALMRFRALAPHVSRSMSGQRFVTFSGPPDYTVEHASFAVGFAIDFSLAVQKRLG